MTLNKSMAQVVYEISQVANSFESSIVIKTESHIIDAKSILGLANLVGIAKEFTLEVHGSDEEEAIKAMKQVFWKNQLPIS